MTTQNNPKVESGIQLITRLRKKKEKIDICSRLFNRLLTLNDTVEISGASGSGKTIILMDIILEALLPQTLSGGEIEVVLFLTDGNLSDCLLLDMLQRRIRDRMALARIDIDCFNTILSECLSRLHLFEIFDATQLYATIQSLDNLFTTHPQISLLAFDTLTAYYWSEQNKKINKMDFYLKNLLLHINKTLKDFSCILVYTKPDYFFSKLVNENEISGKNENVTRVNIIERCNNNIKVVIHENNAKIFRSYNLHNLDIQWYE